MAKKIIFEGAAVQPETREFLIKMAKLAYDDDLNVKLNEVADVDDRNPYEGRNFKTGYLNLVIWREEEVTFTTKPTTPEA